MIAFSSAETLVNILRRIQRRVISAKSRSARLRQIALAEAQ